MAIQVVILAAGMGTRLGKPWPKPLTVLSDGRSIMQQQMENVSKVFGDKARITVVVGFKLEMIIEAHPNASFVYNEIYDQTNTSKSLLKALRASQESGVLWLNGDVVFDSKVLERVADRIKNEKSFVCVNTSATADEEVKYTVNEKGFIKELSKTVKNALGEAVGINFISAHEKANVIAQLENCADQDYFERGLELAIANGEAKFKAVDISDLYAVEVDFAEDLVRANEAL
jgi:choline kinase